MNGERDSSESEPLEHFDYKGEEENIIILKVALNILHCCDKKLVTFACGSCFWMAFGVFSLNVTQNDCL